MSVLISPSSALGFYRPLTEPNKRLLTISNPNSLPVAFKVKTTAPKLYCVRPNAGRIEPGQSVDVSVQLQPLKEEPPLNAKCKDKFLVQSTFITLEKENIPLSEIWNISDNTPENKIHQHRIKVVYLPPEGHIEEVEEQSSRISESRNFETVREQLSQTNGHASTGIPIPSFDSPPVHPMERSVSPVIDESFVVAREEQSRIEELREARGNASPEPRIPSPAPIVNVNVHSPAPPSPEPTAGSNVSNLSTAVSQEREREIAAKLAEAQEEIRRLRQLLAQTPDLSEVRRRGIRSDETVASTEDVQSEAGTYVEHHHTSSRLQEGASPQQNDTAGYGTNTTTGPGIGSQGMGRHHHQGGPGGGHQGMMTGQGMGTGQGMSGQGMGTGQTHHANVQNDFASNAPGNNYNNGPGNNYNNDPAYSNTTTTGHHGLGNAAGVGPGTGGVTGGGGGGFTGPTTNDTPHGYPGQHNNNIGIGGGTGGGGTGASASEKEILGKVERMAGTALCSSSLKAKGLEKEREAQALRAQAAELGQAEGLEAEAAARRQRAVAHGADPQHLGASGPGHRQL
ncbi:hypothetical protein Clacol_009869 [Clathrus columnatus]|uniref:MSP domain-containing protein n=1 Tax=Clathrus columnatus TaxID=1419009 RepID=A0AAV5ATC4_9AGAM|nr:hypothetical protein Clacol_009869 [Clathrus columnatus]